MIKKLIEQKEKKVEYAELVYDLIFVYIVGRNNALLHHTEDGFLSAEAFFTYFAFTLAVIQIWNATTYYINMYGRNSARDHIFLFSNMFLMYFLARGTRSDWQNYHMLYHIAWALVLVNIGMQYLIEQRHYHDDPAQKHRISRTAVIQFCEAAFVTLAIAEFRLQGTTFLSIVAILFGMSASLLIARARVSEIVDFEHLTERAMLYVVLTFGEMIIAIAGYFDGDLTPRSLYFASLGFLIVVGLFLSYGAVFDRVIDRKMQTNGLGYMFIHIFLILALNTTTATLEFMRFEEVDLVQKIALMVGSLIVFFVFLFAATRYARPGHRLSAGFYLLTGGISICFGGLMYLFREFNMVHIALTVSYVFIIFFILRAKIARSEKKENT